MLSPLLRVAGIGDGLFVIFFFVALSVLICWIGLRTETPGSVIQKTINNRSSQEWIPFSFRCLLVLFFSLYCCVAISLSLFIILFMVLVPKAPPGGYTTPDVYDHHHGFRVGVCAVLGISAGVTIILLIGQILLQPIQGSKIRQI